MNNQSADRLIGHKLGHYQITELLGRGNMGAVYKAHQDFLERDVALKILPEELAEEADYVSRFKREIRVLASLEHKNIVPIYDSGIEGSYQYIAMRLLVGGSLADRFVLSQREGQELPALHEISRMLTDIADALDFAHSQGVIHRDIKLANILLSDRGDAFLVDFGIAKLISDHSTTGLTRQGNIIGTPYYLSPEQWSGEVVTPAVDQYALGVVIYALTVGCLPFDGSSVYQLMRNHLEGEPALPPTPRRNVPEAVFPVLKRALAKFPHERWPSVNSFAEAFNKALHGLHGRTSGFFTSQLSAEQIKVASVERHKQGNHQFQAFQPQALASKSPRTPLFQEDSDTVILRLDHIAAAMQKPSQNAKEPPSEEEQRANNLLKRLGLFRDNKD